jgi:SynChlorMet cassette protein ScmC
MRSSAALTGFRFSLTESIWHIHPCDEGAAIVVKALADAMSLSSGRPRKDQGKGDQYHQLRVWSAPDPCGLATTAGESEPVPCQVPSPENKDNLVSGMLSVAEAILRAEQLRGGILIHGALAKTPPPRENGILLAGPGHVGKTTASNRLPLPWSSLCDDATLVIRDGSGKYWAHPWPTWSRFFSTPGGNPGPGGQWNVERRVPLQAIFFLAQAEEDRIVPISFTPALTYLMETVLQVSWPITIKMPSEKVKTLHQMQLAAAEALVRTFPAYILHISLTGTFWKKIEETLNLSPLTSSIATGDPTGNGAGPAQATHVSPSRPLDDTFLTISYTGSSMNPALCHLDLLEILPYSDAARKGDIVYYSSPADGQKVIHRVVRISTNGISTRGDNNLADDPYLLRQQDIIGRVAAAWRHGRRHEIAGGFRGKCSGYNALLRRQVSRSFSSLLHRTYRGLAERNFLHCLEPALYRPRVFEFKHRHLPSILKLMINGRVIGRYDAWTRLWEIDRPWRLIINVTKLPVIDPAAHMDTSGQEKPEQVRPDLP